MLGRAYHKLLNKASHGQTALFLGILIFLVYLPLTIDKYCFILGNNPVLSLAEIFQRGDSLNSNYKVLDITNQSLVVEQDRLNIEDWQARLGGVIKIGTIIKSFDSFDELISHLEKLDNLQSLFKQRVKKIIFGFSFYGKNTNNKNKSTLNKLGLALKKIMAKQGIKSRFIKSVTGSISSVQAQKYKLIDRGADIIIISGYNKYYLGIAETIKILKIILLETLTAPNVMLSQGCSPQKLLRL